jgi:hypothetical protein
LLKKKSVSSKVSDTGLLEGFFGSKNLKLLETIEEILGGKNG